MVRPKKGEVGHEQAKLRWKKTMEEKYGGAEGVHKKMQEIGRKGGRLGRTGGVYGDPERAKQIGHRGGSRSRRGRKFLGETEPGLLKYQVRSTGEIEYVKTEEHERENEEEE